MQHGGSFLFDNAVRIKLTLAFHGSMLPDGSNGGNPCGFIVTLPDGIKIYDAADTALFGDMALIGEEGLDLAILPIGDYYTMGPEDAVRAVKLLRPRFVLPIHYKRFPRSPKTPPLGLLRSRTKHRPSPSSCSQANGLRFRRSERYPNIGTEVVGSHGEAAREPLASQSQVAAVNDQSWCALDHSALGTEGFLQLDLSSFSSLSQANVTLSGPI